MNTPAPHNLAPLILAGKFQRLFVESLGWNITPKAALAVTLSEAVYTLKPVAEKKGVKVWALDSVPARETRNQIEKSVVKSDFEHLIIYHSPDFKDQVWQWPKRLGGRRVLRELPLRQGAHDLSQRLAQISIDLDEEAELTLAEVNQRLARAFDVEKVTKKFFTDFQKELRTFADFIKGLSDISERDWYASLTLNRLMFIYFIQKKGFLDANVNYLRDKLNAVRAAGYTDEFQTFYAMFLRKLFHEGLGQAENNRDQELKKLLGRVPYLNGGLFEIHELEAAHTQLNIADVAFEKLFDFFDRYQWHLDDRPMRADNEINPDVLGHIFEKYINQKEMGAYYTKEDITGYISRNTILPWFFERLGAKTLDEHLWPLLRDCPRDWLYESLLTGLDAPLPPHIAAGLTDVAKRGDWNKAADSALPTETWREHIARRQRVTELLARLERGEITQVSDLITHNLDVEKLAQALIENCQDPRLLKSIWKALTSASILDPTCGSGAFLFAALNILAPLYGLALERMKDFVAADTGGKKHEKFRKVLGELAQHPNQDYFILKRIIMNNLYGVDIMKEAVEICKLRLFLKLAAQLGRIENIEPLPDIDFNIKSGNTLVGYVKKEELVASIRNNTETATLGFAKGMGEETGEVEAILEKAEQADDAYKRFRKLQLNTRHDDSLVETKATLKKRLFDLSKTLDEYLFEEYDKSGIKPVSGKDVKKEKAARFASWDSRHQPFHWLAEFYGIMREGGFDVIIGNPPYKSLTAIETQAFKGYSTLETKNLYPLVMERCDSMINGSGWQGFIVPISSISTDGYKSLQSMMRRRQMFYSSYHERPSKLFDGVDIRLSILILGLKSSTQERIYPSRIYRHIAEERNHLLHQVSYCASSDLSHHIGAILPKVSCQIEVDILKKLSEQERTLGESCSSKSLAEKIYYARKTRYYLNSYDFVPDVFDANGNRRPPSEFKPLYFNSTDFAYCALAILNSSLFFWFFQVMSDFRHLNRREIDIFPINMPALATSPNKTTLLMYAKELMASYKKHSVNIKSGGLKIQAIYPRKSKPIIDEIDTVLAKHYGFTDEELDFIINYDIKYRMGSADDED